MCIYTSVMVSYLYDWNLCFWAEYILQLFNWKSAKGIESRGHIYMYSGKSNATYIRTKTKRKQRANKTSHSSNKSNHSNEVSRPKSISSTFVHRKQWNTPIHRTKSHLKSLHFPPARNQHTHLFTDQRFPTKATRITIRAIYILSPETSELINSLISWETEIGAREILMELKLQLWRVWELVIEQPNVPSVNCTFLINAQRGPNAITAQ